MSARFPRVAVAVAVLLAAVAVPPAATGTATAAASASFSQTVVTDQRGDVVNVTVTASKPATVNFGSAQKGFWLQVDVGKGTTTLQLNTYKAGRFQRYPLSKMVTASKGSITGRSLRTDSLREPMDPANYEMNITIDGYEHAIGTLALRPRSTDGISTSIAPRTTKMDGLTTTEAVRQKTVPPWNASVAHGDWLVVHVNASGIEGALEKSRLDGDGDAGLRLEFSQTNPKMNADGNEFTAATAEYLVLDGSTNGFDVAIDTAKHGIEPGDVYEISFVVSGDSYLTEKSETVTTKMRVVKRQVNIDRNGPGPAVVVKNRTKITGKTTLTPGTTINISARDTGLRPFLIPKTVTVGPDRRFATTFDFSDLGPGREFEIRLPDQKRSVRAIVEAKIATTTTTAPETTTTTTNQTPTTTETPTATTSQNGSGEGSESSETTNPPTTTTTTVAGLTQAPIGGTERALTEQAAKSNATDTGNGGPVPGFDVISGLVALLAAAVLALRRR